MGCGSSKETTPLPPQVRLSPVSRTLPPPQHGTPVASTAPGPTPYHGPTPHRDPVLNANAQAARQVQGQLRAQQRTASDSSGQPPRWPKIVKIQDLPLIVYIFSHTRHNPKIGRSSCWTYISSGLQAVDQPEIVLTVRQLPSEDLEDWPMMPITWARTLYTLAESKSVNVQPGQMCEIFFQDPCLISFGETSVIYESDLSSWSDFRHIGMLVHLEPYGIINDLPPLPYPHHHVIALSHQEASVAKQFGCHRVISRMVFASSCFPLPLWIEREGHSAVRLSDNAGSIHTKAQVKRARIHGLSVIIENDCDLVIRVPDDPVKRRAFQNHVAQTRPIDGWGCESFIPGDADSILSWTTGNTAPELLAKGQNLACTSVAFLLVGLQPDYNHCSMVEDGYCLVLMQGTWNQLRAAMIAGRNFDMRMFDQTAVKSVNVSLRWRRGGQEPPKLVWQNQVGVSQ